MPTSFQRMKMAWREVYNVAKSLRGRTSCTFSQDGQSLRFCRIRGSAETNHAIELSTFRQAAHSILDELECHISEFYKLTGADRPSEIKFDSVRDNVVKHASIYQQNDDLFKPLVADLWGRAQRLNPKLRRCLELERLALEALASLIALTSGIPPRAFQVAGLLYGSTDAERRNLFIVDGLPVLAYPRAKSWWRTYQASLWALPQRAAVPIHILLGILRPVAIQITSNVLSARCPEMLTHIFVRTVGRSGRSSLQVWKSADLVDVIGMRMLAHFRCRLTLGDLRQIISSVFSRHFPAFITDPSRRGPSSTSVANAAAGHGGDVEERHYGQSDLAKAFVMSDRDMRDFMRLGRVWHPVSGMARAEDGSQDNLRQLSDFCHREKLSAALDLARSLVCQLYHIGGGADVSKIISDVQDICEHKPFLKLEVSIARSFTCGSSQIPSLSVEPFVWG
jgi:hypothetical protein